jgi:hypothetical protein
MIAIDFNSREVQANAFSQTAEVFSVEDGSESELFLPNRVAASNVVAELLAVGIPDQTTEGQKEFAIPDEDWSAKHDHRFAVLAEREAFDQLSLDDKKELEHLAKLRRTLKNSRRGEELLWEYEQRKLTRGLVEAITRYVHFHQASSRT